MSNFHGPFRYDHVGSFLRPAEVKNAREQFKAGQITAEQLKAVEDEEITKLVAKQKAAGYHAITDGEFRRSLLASGFYVGIQRYKGDRARPRIFFPRRGNDSWLYRGDRKDFRRKPSFCRAF